MLVTIVAIIVVLSILVLVHEFGHFIVAKLLKIKVEEFGFGLPPRAFGIKRGETIYSINFLPIGGFVKLFGEDEAGSGKLKLKGQKEKTKDMNRAFFARPAWQRLLVVVAGVVMNFLLAVVIFSYLFSAVGVSTPGKKVVITNLSDNSPAIEAGLKVGDTIEEINGKKVTDAGQILTVTKKYLGEKISIKVKNENEKVRDVEITPRKEYPKDEGPMGVSISQNVEIKKYPWYEAPLVGVKEALNISFLIISGIGMIFYQLIVSGSVPGDVAGPVGIAQLTGKFVKLGIYPLMSFVSFFSLNLAILNILPIPALDGGRLLFILIEVVTGRKVNRKFEGYAHAIGMALLLGLIILITAHDLVRLFSGQPILPNIQ
ncbi:MAG TPA: RIP metalloprotease RseP [Patescibacteria group bacterium]|nr:RIP metalloprotease RseP [Patescibacteria group bacterium]